MRVSKFARFFWKERGVDATEDDERASLAGQATNFISSKRASGIDADTDDVPRLHKPRVERFQHLVDQPRHAVERRRRASEDELPTRRHDGDAKCRVAWIDEVYLHGALQSSS